MTWKRNKGTYRYASANGWYSDKGSYYISYPFIIHKEPHYSSKWALSHIATGRQIGLFRLLKHAKECGDKLERFNCFLMPTTDAIISAYSENLTKTEILRILTEYREK